MNHILLFSFISLSLQGIIVEHHCIRAIKSYIPATLNPKDVLIVLDLDDTVAMSILDPKITPWFNKVLWPKDIPDVPFKHRFNYIVQLKPMEQCTLPFLKELQKDGYPTIILTFRHASIAMRTHDQLTKLGIDFSNGLSLPNHTFMPPSMDPVPFHKGILLTSRQDKGLVLDHFIDQHKLAPKLVVFADDLIKNAQAVDSAMKAKKIDCVAIHHTKKRDHGISKKIGRSLAAIFGY